MTAIFLFGFETISGTNVLNMFCVRFWLKRTGLLTLFTVADMNNAVNGSV